MSLQQWCVIGTKNSHARKQAPRKCRLCDSRYSPKARNIVYTETPVLNDRLWRGLWITEGDALIVSACAEYTVVCTGKLKEYSREKAYFRRRRLVHHRRRRIRQSCRSGWVSSMSLFSSEEFGACWRAPGRSRRCEVAIATVFGPERKSSLRSWLTDGESFIVDIGIGYLKKKISNRDDRTFTELTHLQPTAIVLVITEA